MDYRISRNIRNYSFVFTCFMVFYHIGQIYDSSRAMNFTDTMCNTLLNYIFTVMGSLSMCYFFMVTGFLLFYNLNYSTLLHKLKRRFKSLFVPYCLWQVIIAIVNCISSRALRYSLTEFVRKTFFLIQWPINGALWYMYAVFLLAILSPVLLVLFKNKKIGIVVIVTISVIVQKKESIVLLPGFAWMNYGYVPNILTYLPSYLIGCFCGLLFDDTDNKTHADDDAVWYAVLLIIVSFLLQGTFKGLFGAMTMKMLPVFMIMKGKVHFDIFGNSALNLTFLMYAIHQKVIAIFVDKLNALLFGFQKIPISLANIAGHIVILSLDIGIAAIISIILSKTSPKILFLVTGGRCNNAE